MATDIGEFDMFQIVPDTLIWIQVWSVSREALQPDAVGSTSGQKGLDGLTAMNGRAIPNDEQLAFDGAQQLLQKGDDRRTIVSCALHRQIEFTRRCNGAYHRVMITGKLAAQKWRLTHWSPSADNTGQQIEGGFVNEENRASFGYGFFCNSGQVISTHCSMAASSRWLARTTGRCGLQPSWRSKGPI